MTNDDKITKAFCAIKYALDVPEADVINPRREPAKMTARRLFIVLLRRDDVSFTDIAEVLKCSITNVSRMYSRAAWLLSASALTKFKYDSVSKCYEALKSL